MNERLTKAEVIFEINEVLDELTGDDVRMFSKLTLRELVMLKHEIKRAVDEAKKNVDDDQSAGT